jgi:putative MATE family efflux protein
MALDERKISKMVEGPIFKTLFFYSLPIVIMNMLQLLFHAADVAVLGVMAGDAEVAAVGACGSLISMLVCLFSGYSSAANVVISRRVGRADVEGARRATGTALVLGFLSGVILMVVTLVFARQFLIMTNCQPEILDMATLYMRIYFLGMPITMLYNFVAAILRATGDSMRPMVYMIVSGVVNVFANILFVGALDMTVDGVAWATVLSKTVSLVLALIALAKNNGYCKVELKNLRIRKDEFIEMMRIGIPACVEGITFYFGEVVVVAGVNSISTDAMAGNAIASQIDRLVYIIGSSIGTASGVVVAQNFGAGKLERVRQVVRISMIYTVAATLVSGIIAVLIDDAVLGLLTESAAVIELAKGRMILTCLTNFITCASVAMGSAVRALKKPYILLVAGIVGGFAVRSFWTWFAWPLVGGVPFLFIALPLSTFVALIMYAVVYFRAMKEHELAQDMAKEI